MNLQIVLERLEKVRKSGDGFMACCPAHEDNVPSLRISDGGDKVLLCCYAGCRIDDICTAIGLELYDLWECMTPPKKEYAPRLTARDLKGFAHSKRWALDVLRAKSEGMDVDALGLNVEKAAVEMMRFGEKYGTLALQAVVEIHRAIYWQEHRHA